MAHTMSDATLGPTTSKGAAPSTVVTRHEAGTTDED